MRSKCPERNRRNVPNGAGDDGGKTTDIVVKVVGIGSDGARKRPQKQRKTLPHLWDATLRCGTENGGADRWAIHAERCSFLSHGRGRTVVELGADADAVAMRAFFGGDSLNPLGVPSVSPARRGERRHPG